jgi:hypothetical protein
MNCTTTFDALGFTFTVSADDARLAAYVDRLFDALRASGPARHRYHLGAAGAGSLPMPALLFDGERVREAPDPEGLVMPLVHDVNQRAVGDSELLTIHAGGVEHEDAGLVFPGPTEAGKTTLVAGLVRAGFGYLTDEAVAIDREALLIRPYPKPLCLDPGSWPLFPELEPRAELTTTSYKADEWPVPSEAIGPGARGGSCRVGLIVFPRFERGARTALEPIRRAEALVELAKYTFGFKDQGRVALDPLADVVRRADCYRLTMGGLDPALDLVSGVTGANRANGEVR